MNILNEIQSGIDVCLSNMESITLDEMSSIKLMNRIDTKYVVGIETLQRILQMAEELYRVQTINGNPRQAYTTTYLDTLELDMYTAHHNGHKTREKIRVRTYMDSKMTFLEVKNKNNRGRTDKKRIPLESEMNLRNETAEAFLNRVADFRITDIQPVVRNTFKRITLVNKEMTERLTIDTDLAFSNLMTKTNATLYEVAIIEVKRDGRVHSPIMHILNLLRIKQMGFSKYCIGTALTNNKVRQNRFKERLRTIDKLKRVCHHKELDLSY